MSKGTDIHSHTGPHRDTDTLHFNWASLNTSGNPTASNYTVRAEVTGEGGGTWEWPGWITAGGEFSHLPDDQPVGPLSAGPHTFRVWLDHGDDIDEGSEGNNYAERTINVEPGGRVPVVLVHGLSGSPDTTWETLADHLVERGYEEGVDLFRCDNLDTGILTSRDTIDNADLLAEYVRTTLALQSADQIDIVAHSWGGLISRRYSHLAESMPVRNLIMLGTPNLGTWIIRWLRMPVLTRSLSPDGLVAFNENHPPASNSEHFFIAGTGGGNPLLEGPDDTWVTVRSVFAETGEDPPFPRPPHNLKWTTSDSHGNLHETESTLTQISNLLAGRGWDDSLVPQRAPGATVAQAEPGAGAHLVMTEAGGGLAAETEEFNVQIDSSDSAHFQLSAFDESSLVFSLVDPDGVAITPSSFSSYLGSSYREDPVAEPFPAWQYTIANPRVGLWRMRVLTSNPTPGPQSDYAVAGFVTGDLSLRVEASPLEALTSEPVVLQATLAEGSQVVPGATITAAIRRPDESVNVVPLLDDGSSGDGEANDGVFGTLVSDATIPGIHDVEVTATGTRSTGDAFQRIDFTLFTMGAGSASFGLGTFGEATPDADGNGLFESLDVSFQIDVSEAGDFWVIGTLARPASETITAAVADLDDLAMGAQIVTLSFPGEAIFRAQTDGPWRIVNLRLVDERGEPVLIDFIAEAFVTSAHGAMDFERPQGFGDPNWDGAVNAADLVHVVNHMNGTVILSPSALRTVDLDGDAEVEPSELSLLIGVILGTL